MAESVKRYRLDGDEIYIDTRNPIFPFNKGVLVYTKRYVVGTDFDSGDNLRLDLDGCQSVLFAVAKTPTNSFLTIAETDLATETSDAERQGKSLTTGTSTTDVEVLVIASV